MRDLIVYNTVIIWLDVEKVGRARMGNCNGGHVVGGHSIKGGRYWGIGYVSVYLDASSESPHMT